VHTDTACGIANAKRQILRFAQDDAIFINRGLYSPRSSLFALSFVAIFISNEICTEHFFQVCFCLDCRFV
jgi:hypothetical protein